MIRSIYEAGDSTLVFPSEVVAAQWRRSLATSGRTAAIRTDRVISWDTFKEGAIPIKNVRRPATTLIRRAFAEDLIEENARRSFLHELVAPSFAATRPDITDDVTQLLPQLPSLLTRRNLLRSNLLNDLEAVFVRYRKFLDDFALFEPNWEARRGITTDRFFRRPVIVWPELLEDFPDYRENLAGLVETVATPHLDESVSTGRVHEYRQTREEINATFSAVERLVDSGRELHEIAITAADLPAVRPWIVEAATRRNVPIRFGAGEALIDQAGGAVFRRIDDVLQERFHVAAVAALLLNRSVPWRDPEQNRRLVEFGFQTHCYNANEWEYAFSTARRLPRERGYPGLDALRRRFQTFYRDISAVASASSVVSMRRALRRFLDDFIASKGDDAWGDDAFRTAERVYETVLNELAGLVSIEERGVPIHRPWRFFLDTIAGRTYVFNDGVGALTVYPYRVAAGVPTYRHFVIGLSQSATRVRRRPPLGLRSDDVERIGLSAYDRSAAFLAMYVGGLENGVCSTARETPSGTQIPAPEIAALIGGGDDDASVAVTPWEREQRWWRDPDAPPVTTMYRRQYDGLRRAVATTLNPVRVDFQSETVPPALLPRLAIPTEWSSQSFDAYVRCPFSFFIRRALAVSDVGWGYNAWNPLVYGTALHDVVATALDESSADANEAIAANVRRVFESPKVALFLPRIGAEARIEYVARVVEALREIELLGVGRADATERSVTTSINGITVTGRVDRVVRDASGITIVDFKTHVSGRHTANNVLPPSGFSASTTLQLPLYALMIDAIDRRDATADDDRTAEHAVERLLYVDLTKASVKAVADRSARHHVPRDAWARLDAAFDTLPEFFGGIVEAVESGDMRCGDDADCGACGIRGICRRCFVTRRFSDGS